MEYVSDGEVDVPVRKPHRRRSKTPEDATAAAETKKELKRAKHIMKQLETKMKIMEEEHQKKATQLAASNPGGHIVLEKQVKCQLFDYRLLQQKLPTPPPLVLGT